MELHRCIINSGSRRVRLRPFGDLQMGAAGFREDLWIRFKRDVMADKDSYLIGMGDYSDNFRPTIRKKLRSALAEDDAYEQIDYPVMAQMQKLAEELKPFKHRIIGLLEGHHFHRLISGQSSTQYLCQLLGVKFLDFFAGVQLIIRQGGSMKGGGGGYTVDMIATHGCGGAKYQHSDLAVLERNLLPSYDCDIILRGHSTKVQTAFGPPLNRLIWNKTNQSMRMGKRQRLLVNTGGFMEGYVQGRGSGYVEQANLPPCALGWAVIEFYKPFVRDSTRSTFEMIPQVVVPQ